MLKHWPIALAFLVVLLGPILLRPKQEAAPQPGERSLVVVTPHVESIRFEFGRAWEQWHERRTGEKVRVDFRTPGGTSEIARYVDGGFNAAFENYWRNVLKREWSNEVQRAFQDGKIKLDDTPEDDTLAEQARRAYLASNVSCRIDVFFGGGAYDFQSQARKGNFVDSGFIAAHPELFASQNGEPPRIPQVLSGEPFYDPEGRWIGAVLSCFGIVCNLDAIKRLGIEEPPQQWEDLADPRFFREIALANPTQSSSVNKSFEMLIQQQMQLELAERRKGAGEWSKADEEAAVAAGWDRAIRLLMKIGANARYFTDYSTKIPIDVSTGDCAAGMTIDFYGRYQSEAVRRRDGSSPVRYVNVRGGTSVGVDPIAMFRGAPNPDLARSFIEFVMSEDGQKLWNWQVGTPGGPQRYALRRSPILPAIYRPDYAQFRSDPDVQPYELAKDFNYYADWTASLFSAHAFIFRVMCIDTHDELTDAWSALIDAGFPPRAMEVFENVEAVNYQAARTVLREATDRNAPKIRSVQVARDLAEHFAQQYRRAAELARAGQ